MIPRRVPGFPEGEPYATNASAVSLIVQFLALTCSSAGTHGRVVELCRWAIAVLVAVLAVLLAARLPFPELLEYLATLA